MHYKTSSLFPGQFCNPKHLRSNLVTSWRWLWFLTPLSWGTGFSYDLHIYWQIWLFPGPFMEILFPYRNTVTHAATAGVLNFTTLQACSCCSELFQPLWPCQFKHDFCGIGSRPQCKSTKCVLQPSTLLST